MERIKISSNRRYLVTENEKPFFWLGDTAWELVHRLKLNEANEFFANRQKKGYNVIQIVILAEIDGLNTPNVYNECPLIDNDPAKPNEAYFKYVDELIDLAAEYQIYLGLLPTWGDKVTHLWGAGPVIFNHQNAKIYGQFLGSRYRDRKNIIWILGGDRPAFTNEHDYRLIWSEMAEGLDIGSQVQTIKTYHPIGGESSSKWLQDQSWLDFHMLQSGHGGKDLPVWDMISHDYSLTPPRPVLDGEPNYEDHPISPWPKWDPENGYFTAHDVRKQLYRSVFAGGCGVTYGHHSIWQMITPWRDPITHPLFFDWHYALDRPGSYQVGNLRTLMESRPYLSRIPDQEILINNYKDHKDHQQATRNQDSSYAMVYVPSNKVVTIQMDRISGDIVQAWWFNPRNGCSKKIGLFPASGTAVFNPPAYGPDWVLVLDDSTKNYPIPEECSSEL